MTQKNKDINLKDLIEIFMDYYREWIKYWWVVLLAIIGTTSYLMYKTSIVKPNYPATIKYLVEGEGSSSIGSLGNILGSLGVGGPSKNNPFKIIEVAKSKYLWHDILFTRTECSPNYIINDIMEAYDYKNTIWQDNPQMQQVYFDKDSLKEFSKEERLAFIQVYSDVLGLREGSMPILDIFYDKKKGIYQLDANARTECLAVDLTNETYEKVKDFFENKLNEEQRFQLEVLVAKVDSLEILLKAKNYEVADIEDRNRNIISKQVKAMIQNVTLDYRKLSTYYFEASKQHAIAELSLESTKPLFLKIDSPYTPIWGGGPNYIRAILMGVLLGGFLAIGFISARKLYVNVMAEH